GHREHGRGGFILAHRRLLRDRCLVLGARRLHWNDGSDEGQRANDTGGTDRPGAGAERGLLGRIGDGSQRRRPRRARPERSLHRIRRNWMGCAAGGERHFGLFTGGLVHRALRPRRGWIYTKAADVGADLAGKVYEGIPEDDPRNPATIADNVGDNVGDVAGMGADLFESFVGAIIGTMVLGTAFNSAFAGMGFFELSGVILPLVLAAVGIIVSILGSFFVRVKEGGNPQKGLNTGEFGAAGVMAVLSYVIITMMLPERWTVTGE